MMKPLNGSETKHKFYRGNKFYNVKKDPNENKLSGIK